MTWLQLWAFGRYDLGLSEAEFWRLTLRELVALIKRYENQQEQKYYRVGIICSTLVNLLANTKGKTYRPEDFIPVRKPKKQSWQEQMSILKAITEGMKEGGE